MIPGLDLYYTDPSQHITQYRPMYDLYDLHGLGGDMSDVCPYRHL